MTASEGLGPLIDACIDDERMLHHESRSMSGPRGDVLGRLGDERARFVERLEGLSGDERRSHGGSWMERGRELGRDFRGWLGGQSDSDSVAACLRSCRRTEARLEQALALSWPDGIQTVLVAERARFASGRDAMVAIQF